MIHIFQLLILALVKVLDNIIMVLKSISTYKGQKILSSILVVLSQLMFYFIIKEVVDDSTIVLMLTISIASGVGNYIGFIINDKYKKNSKYINIITSSNIDGMFDLNDYLVINKIKCVLNKSLNRKKEDSYSLIVFSNTKEQSKLIDKYLENVKWKYLREILM